MALAPLHREFGVESLIVTTFQATSGAGYPAFHRSISSET